PFALAVEGATGPVDTTLLASFPDQRIKGAAFDYLMREGMLSGMEYYAAMQGLSHALTGVEEESYYTLHRDLFRKTYKDREELVRTLKELQRVIQGLKRRVYGRALRHFEARYQAYKRGKMSRAKYVPYLGGEARQIGMELEPPTQSGLNVEFWDN